MSCSHLKTQYNTYVQKLQAMDEAIASGIQSGDFSHAQQLKQELLAIQESLEVYRTPFVREFKEANEQENIKEQYLRKRTMYVELGLIQQEGERYFITTIDDKKYDFPTLSKVNRAIQQYRKEHPNRLETKIDQLFTNMHITPFGRKWDDLRTLEGEQIRKHFVGNGNKDPHNTKKSLPDPEKTHLFSRNADGTRVALPLNESEPVWIWPKYKNADTEGRLFYFPERFQKENHGGKTKMQLLKEQGENAAFRILFFEQNATIPKAGANQETGTKTKRKRIEANKSPDTYVNLLQTDSHYKGELGMTPEDQIVCAMAHLHETDEVVDDWNGTGKANFLIGAYFPEEGENGLVAIADWDRGGAQAFFDRDDPGRAFPVVGCRAAVGVDLKI